MSGEFQPPDNEAEFEQEDAAQRDQPFELFLCEIPRTVLKPDRLYIFKVDPACDKCVRAEIASKGGEKP